VNSAAGRDPPTWSPSLLLTTFIAFYCAALPNTWCRGLVRLTENANFDAHAA
jgi:hypothetical protein